MVGETSISPTIRHARSGRSATLAGTVTSENSAGPFSDRQFKVEPSRGCYVLGVRFSICKRQGVQRI